MRKKMVVFLIFIAFSGQNTFASKIEKTNTEKRVNILEKKVVKIEKRVDDIESKIGIQLPAQKDKKIDENPLNIIYVSKDKLIGASKSGIKLNFKIYNPTRIKINAFMGDIILKDENEIPFYKYKFYYDQSFNPQSYIDAVILILDSQTGIYLKLLKLDKIKVEFINQKIYTGDEI